MFKDRFKPDPNDFIIVVMGPTGSGKTNFINSVTGNAEQRSAGNLKSDTQQVTPYRISGRGVRLVLVDTPGFDDTYRQDTEILRTIADWLTQKYPNRKTLKVTGLIYLHRIADNRMSGSAHKNLQVFGRLCGDVPLPRTRLVTTMWDLVKDEEVAKKRETELSSKFWKPLIDGGATVQKFDNTLSSAREIVDDLVRMGNGSDELLLQEELVEQQKRLNETEAGKVLYNRLQQLLEDQKRTLRELVEEAKLQNDPTLAKSLQEECQMVDAKLHKTFEEMKGLKIPFYRRILLWLSKGKTRARAIELD